jgi:hypothetical protein
MKDLSHAVSPALDAPEISNRLFFPQPAWARPASQEGVHEALIPVDPGVSIAASYYLTDRQGPSILFFHGNGEIVDDYADAAPLYASLGVNFLPADYRGYGRSTGRPSVSTMLRDAHAVFEHARAWLQHEGCTGPLVVMGRSLGSASALELAAGHPDAIDGLIVESGFAHSQTLLDLVGFDMAGAGVTEETAFRHLDTIARFTRPTLIIHAELDDILPLPDGEALYAAAGAAQKRLLVIEGANHNNIFSLGMPEYLSAIRSFVTKLR